MKCKSAVIRLFFSLLVIIIAIGCAKTQEKPAASKPAEAFVDTGVIVVDSSPKAAQVYVDSEMKGESPLTLYNFPVGKHDIIVKKDGFDDFKKTITLQVGKTEEISAVLSENSGKSNVDKKFLDDPMYCEKDSDCTLQQTEETCRSCACPQPLNIYNYKPLDCSKLNIQGFCDVYCKPSTANCANNICTLTEKTASSTQKPSVQENKSAPSKSQEPVSSLNKANISSSFVTYYDLKNGMFTETSSAYPDVFSSNYNTYLYFTAYSPATMKLVEKQIQDVTKDDCSNTQDTIVNLYSGQTLCVKTTDGKIAAIGGKWDSSPKELSWILFS